MAIKSGLDFGPQVKKPVFATSKQLSTPSTVKQETYPNQQEEKMYKHVTDNDMSSEEEITLAHIIKKKPKTKVVREFFRANLKSIRSENDLLFE